MREKEENIMIQVEVIVSHKLFLSSDIGRKHFLTWVPEQQENFTIEYGSKRYQCIVHHQDYEPTEWVEVVAEVK